VLKVVPAPDGIELDPDGEVAVLLRAEQASGSEIVVHGYTHRTAGPLRGSVIDTARARAFAPDDAEFLSVEIAEATRRLRAGREALERAGLHATAFCAPGWLAPAWIGEAAATAGFGCVIGLVRVADLGRRRTRSVPAFGYLGADWLQERLAGVGGDTSIALHRWLPDRLPDLRAFLHPSHAQISPACARTLERIGRTVAREPAGTYADLLRAGPAVA
jgi:hypothetical protein